MHDTNIVEYAIMSTGVGLMYFSGSAVYKKTATYADVVTYNGNITTVYKQRMLDIQILLVIC